MTAGPVCLRSPRLLPGVGVCFVLVGTSGRLPMETTRDVWSETIHKSSVESVWHFDRVFPCRVYLNRIATTLGYEYHLFVTVIT
jgi:hypothetical protein